MIVNGIMFSASNVKYTILLLLHFPSYQKHYMLDKGSSLKAKGTVLF